MGNWQAGRAHWSLVDAYVSVVTTLLDGAYLMHCGLLVGQFVTLWQSLLVIGQTQNTLKCMTNFTNFQIIAREIGLFRILAHGTGIFVHFWYVEVLHLSIKVKTETHHNSGGNNLQALSSQVAKSRQLIQLGVEQSQHSLLSTNFYNFLKFTNSHISKSRILEL